MRFLLANLLRGERDNQGDQPIDFHSAVSYVPEYGLHTQEVKAAARPRVLKSHSPLDELFPRVVYIVRDPRDVYVSYYHYLRKRLPGGTSFGSFLRKPDLHPCHWHEHVAGWIGRRNVHVIRYEDMLANTSQELRKLIDFWGQRSYTDQQVQSAVQASSFKQMKSLENQNGRPFRSEVHRQQSTRFMRSGKQGDWVNYYEDSDLVYLTNRCGALMNRLGYDEPNTRSKAG